MQGIDHILVIEQYDKYITWKDLWHFYLVKVDSAYLIRPDKNLRFLPHPSETGDEDIVWVLTPQKSSGHVSPMSVPCQSLFLH